MITYDYYRIFYYVAQYKSFTKAAAALGNNQPNITRCMNNLEAELDCKLFLRSNKGVLLTPEGHKLYEHVAIAFEQLALGEEAIIRFAAVRVLLPRGDRPAAGIWRAARYSALQRLGNGAGDSLSQKRRGAAA